MPRGSGRVLSAEPESLKRIHVFKQKDSAFKSRNLLNKVKIEDMQSLLDNDLDIHFDEEKKNTILKNNAAHNKIRFGNVDKNRATPHIDGILQADDSGELLYFIALEDDKFEGSINEIEEGCKVEFDDEYHGVCEVILHKREQHKKIVGDIELREPVIVRYVRVTKIVEPVTPRPYFRA
ncbi:MAG: hypothetical protein AAF944_02965 [Bacteroidota bacterium]